VSSRGPGCSPWVGWLTPARPASALRQLLVPAVFPGGQREVGSPRCPLAAIPGGGGGV